MDNSQMGGMVCHCGRRKIMPWLVVLFGLAFLLEAVGTLSAGFVSIAWPILVIIAGLLKLGACKCYNK